jgi:transcriptional regulator with XRE-family HTH domain
MSEVTELTRTVSNNLRELMDEQSLSARKVATLSGLSQWSVSALLRVEHSPTIDSIHFLATGLKIRPEELLK